MIFWKSADMISRMTMIFWKAVRRIALKSCIANETNCAASEKGFISQGRTRLTFNMPQLGGEYLPSAGFSLDSRKTMADIEDKLYPM